MSLHACRDSINEAVDLPVHCFHHSKVQRHMIKVARAIHLRTQRDRMQARLTCGSRFAIPASATRHTACERASMHYITEL